METENRNNQTNKSPKNKKKKMKFSQMSKKRQKRYIRNGILATIAVVGVVSVALILNLVYGILQETAEFDKEKLMAYEPFTILDSNDQPIYSYGVEPIEFEEIPQVMIDALVAAEDSRYYEHNGFDIPRILKAVYDNVTHGGITSGASTITQQTIKKKYYPNEEQTYTRKIGEIFLAIQADAEMDKDTILACYLNTIYFGTHPSTQGLKAGARYYFGKEVNQLTLPEAAYLAGVLNAPSAFDAYYYLEDAQARRDKVLDLMLLHGYITEEEHELALATKLENQLVKSRGDGLEYEPYQAYVDAVLEETIQELYKDKMTPEEIYEQRGELIKETLKKNLTIHTYMNTEVQGYIDEEIATGNASGINFYGDNVELAGSVQDNYTGRVVALMGGRDYVDYTVNPDLDGPKVFGYNRATAGKQSPGSSLKPLIAYGPGIEFLDWPTFSSCTDEPYSDEGGPLYDWDRGDKHGSMSFQSALSSSWNIPAVKALRVACEEVGHDKIIEFINGLGLTVNDYDGRKYGDFNYRYAIGAMAEGVTMMQEAGAYATIVNGGTYYKPHTINYIENNRDGTKIMIDENIAANSYRAISEQGAFMIRELMRSYGTQYGYIGSASYDLGLGIGAKSGTSTNDRGENKGYIMATFTPDYSLAFWTGKDNSSEEISSSNQMTPYAAISHLLYALHEDGKVHEYSSAPSGVAQATVQLGKEPTEKAVLANAYTPDKYKITGWYKTSNPPVGGEIPKVDPLKTFDVTCTEDKNFTVKFAPYNKKYTDMPENFDPNKTLNPDFMYGRIVYVTIIRDAATGAELFKNVSNEPDVTFEFEINSEVQVIGKYQFSLQEKLASEEVTRNVKPTKVNLPEISASVSTTDTGATISVNASYPDNSITISVTGPNGFARQESYKNKAYCELALSDLAPGDYTVQITETDKKQTTSQKKTLTFTINAPKPIEPEEPVTPPTNPADGGTATGNEETQV